VKRRAGIPPEVQADVLAACRRRCCVCFALQKDDKQKRGQIAHLDHNRNNNKLVNLAFLCLPHHDEFDSQTSQSKGLSINEMKRYRTELLAFLSREMPPSDEEIISQLTGPFDRPAFRTPFRHESSLPRFREALAETIETVNTGRTPQELQLSSKMQIRDVTLRSRVDHLVQALVSLRSTFDDLVRRGEIRHCACGDPDCPVHHLSPIAIQEMDARRLKLLSLVHELNPSINEAFHETK